VRRGNAHPEISVGVGLIRSRSKNYELDKPVGLYVVLLVLSTQMLFDTITLDAD